MQFYNSAEGVRDEMLSRVARFLARWRLLVVAGWAIVMIVSIPLASRVTHNLSSSGFEDPNSGAVWADRQLQQVHSVGTPTLLIEGVSSRSVQALARSLGIPAQDVRTTAPQITVVLPVEPVEPASLQSLRRLASGRGATVRTVDDLAVGEQVLKDARVTLAQSLPIALPLVVILLLLVFGSVASAVLPLVVASVGSAVALAVIDLIENHITLSAYLTDIVSFLALGVGVDYALFISARFRDELARTGDVDVAVGETMRHAGRSVLYSGVAVAAAVSTLLFGGDAYWRGIALGGAVAVAAVLLATHTLLPAVLRFVGHRIDWGRIPLGSRPAGGMWAAVGRFVSRRPVAAVLLGLVLLGTPAWFGLQLQMRTPANLAVLLPRNDPLRKATALEQRLIGPGAIAPIVLAMRLPAGVTAPATWQAVAQVTKRLSSLPGVRRVDSPSSLGPGPQALALAEADPGSAPPPLVQALRTFTGGASDPHLVILYVTAKSGPDAAATVSLIHRMQRDVPHWLPAGSRSGVGGVSALLDGFDRLTLSRLPWMLCGVALVAFLVLLAATGSIWQPLLGVAFDGLVALATAGLLVLTVQRGAFGLAALAPDSSITPLIFVLLFGLSMDYEVILLHRVQEFVRARAPARDAAAKGLAATGGMITGAGMIMVVVFVALIVSPLEIMQTLALGMTAAILLDTWVVRTLLVPGTIALLSRYAFWPAQRPPEGGGRRKG